MPLPVKYWEIIADNLKKAGWSLGWVSAVDSEGEQSGLRTHIRSRDSVAFGWQDCSSPAIWVFVLSGLLVAVQFDVALGRFTRVMRRMQMMPMGSMRMMRRHFVFASTMMLGRFAMVLRGVFMMLSGFRVMFFKFFWH